MKTLFNELLLVLIGMSLMSVVTHTPIVSLTCTSNLPAIETLAQIGACGPDQRIVDGHNTDALALLGPGASIVRNASEVVHVYLVDRISQADQFMNLVRVK